MSTIVASANGHGRAEAGIEGPPVPEATASQAGQAFALSPHTALMGEIGRTLLLDAMETGRDFCNAMIGLANGAVPVYLGLLGFVMPKDYRPTLGEAVVALVPAALFLAAAIAFARGYFPKVHVFNIDLPDEVNRVHSEIVYRRLAMARLGFALFCVAMVGSVSVTLLACGRRPG